MMTAPLPGCHPLAFSPPRKFPNCFSSVSMVARWPSRRFQSASAVIQSLLCGIYARQFATPSIAVLLGSRPAAYSWKDGRKVTIPPLAFPRGCAQLLLLGIDGRQVAATSL
ncbi:hypothetical protein DPMN_124980 [Dreissena polymorpha]|uniref:Uncharacterized protein n=1 Tax=Dreissena polymorpha TaxID=45954 RepID=A0A9D4GXB7_DREPO|nr:hypothetical protein DPMN_124980 [Dreissena polymorpha]